MVHVVDGRLRGGRRDPRLLEIRDRQAILDAVLPNHRLVALHEVVDAVLPLPLEVAANVDAVHWAKADRPTGSEI